MCVYMCVYMELRMIRVAACMRMGLYVRGWMVHLRDALYESENVFPTFFRRLTHPVREKMFGNNPATATGDRFQHDMD